MRISRGYFIQKTRGQVALIIVILFLFVSLIVVGGLALLGISQIHNSNSLVYGKKSYATAESMLEDAVHRIDSGKNYNNVDIDGKKNLTSTLLNGGAGTDTRVSIDDSIAPTFALSATSTLSSRIRKITSSYVGQSGSLPGFQSAMQAGYLGIVLEQSACIIHATETPSNCASQQGGASAEHGNVRSNGSIRAEASAGDFITGTAMVARSIANDMAYAQINWNAAPDEGIALKLGDFADNSHDFAAQSFIASETAPVARVDLYMKYVSSGGAQPRIFIKIIANDPSGGVDKPSTDANMIISEKALDSDQCGEGSPVCDWGTFRERHIFLTVQGASSKPDTAYENEKYWIVFYANDTGLNSGKYYAIGRSTVALGDSGYTLGNDQRTCYGKKYCNPCFGLLDSASSTACYFNASENLITPNSNGDGGTLKYSSNGSTWGASLGTDMIFRAYFGEDTTAPDGVTRMTRVTGAETGKDVVAEIIRNSTIGMSGGDAYYKIIDGTVSIPGYSPDCTTTGGSAKCHPGAPYGSGSGDIQNPLPLVTCSKGRWQKCLADLYAKARAGWSRSALYVDTTQSIIGSGVINGDLEVKYSSGILEVSPSVGDPNPVIWIRGDGFLSSGICTIKLKSPAKTLSLIFEGKVDIRNSCQLIDESGAAIQTNFVFVYSLFYDTLDSTEPTNTIYLANNVNQNYLNGVYFAPMGEIRLVNSPRTISLAGTRLYATNNSVITYNSGVAQPGGGGGSSSYIPSFIGFYESP